MAGHVIVEKLQVVLVIPLLVRNASFQDFKVLNSIYCHTEWDKFILDNLLHLKKVMNTVFVLDLLIHAFLVCGEFYCPFKQALTHLVSLPHLRSLSSLHSNDGV